MQRVYTPFSLLVKNKIPEQITAYLHSLPFPYLKTNDSPLGCALEASSFDGFAPYPSYSPCDIYQQTATNWEAEGYQLLKDTLYPKEDLKN